MAPDYTLFYQLIHVHVINDEGTCQIFNFYRQYLHVVYSVLFYYTIHYTLQVLVILKKNITRLLLDCDRTEGNILSLQ